MQRWRECVNLRVESALQMDVRRTLITAMTELLRMCGGLALGSEMGLPAR
jgi:hypothetical protein